MRKPTIIAALCAVWIIALTTGPTTSQAATITVFHGMETETSNTAKRPAGGVHVVRPVSAPASTPSPVVATRATQPYVINASYAAGETLWMRDARTGGLVACAVWSAGIVGMDTIRCTSARLLRARTGRRYNP